MTKSVDLVTFTEEILNGKLHFSCSVYTPGQSNTTFASPFLPGNFAERFRESSLESEKREISLESQISTIFVFVRHLLPAPSIVTSA